MLQVTILESFSSSDLQNKVNEEIMKIEAMVGKYKVQAVQYIGGRIKDIKYVANDNNHPYPYSAMIIYQTPSDFYPIRDLLKADKVIGKEER